MYFWNTVAIASVVGMAAAQPSQLFKRDGHRVFDAITQCTSNNTANGRLVVENQVQLLVNSKHLCIPTVPVDRKGDLNGGLNPSGKKTGDCTGVDEPHQSTAKVIDMCGRKGVMYVWYFHKAQRPDEKQHNHRHNWQNIVVWMDDNQENVVSACALGPWTQDYQCTSVPTLYQNKVVASYKMFDEGPVGDWDHYISTAPWGHLWTEPAVYLGAVDHPDWQLLPTTICDYDDPNYPQAARNALEQNDYGKEAQAFPLRQDMFDKLSVMAWKAARGSFGPYCEEADTFVLSPQPATFFNPTNSAMNSSAAIQRQQQTMTGDVANGMAPAGIPSDSNFITNPPPPSPGGDPGMSGSNSGPYMAGPPTVGVWHGNTVSQISGVTATPHMMGGGDGAMGPDPYAASMGDGGMGGGPPGGMPQDQQQQM